MSKAFREPKACNNSCGAMIYFDPNSTIGHPAPDKWVPLEIKGGMKTDQPHNCPKKKNGNTLPTTTTETTAAIVAKPDTLKIAESLLEILTDYIRLKTKEQQAQVAAAAK